MQEGRNPSFRESSLYSYIYWHFSRQGRTLPSGLPPLTLLLPQMPSPSPENLGISHASLCQSVAGSGHFSSGCPWKHLGLFTSTGNSVRPTLGRCILYPPTWHPCVQSYPLPLTFPKTQPDDVIAMVINSQSFAGAAKSKPKLIQGPLSPNSLINFI